MVEQEPKEFKVGPGRYLVSANMGEGYEHLNDPEKAADAIDFNFTWLVQQISNQMVERGITSEFDQSDVDSDIYRQVETAELEMHWLHGRLDRIHEILERKLPNYG